MKNYLFVLAFLGVTATGIIVSLPGKQSESTSDRSVTWFKDESIAFAATARNLKQALTILDPEETISQIYAKRALKQGKLHMSAVVSILFIKLQPYIAKSVINLFSLQKIALICKHFGRQSKEKFRMQVETEKMLLEAYRYIAGGVVSLNRKVDPAIIFKEGKGSKIYDISGKEYIDYHAAFAPHLLGHNFDAVNDAVLNVISNNISLIGSSTNELEISLAKLVCKIIPSLKLVQITNTGSEATAHAIRLSRAYTGKEHIILMTGGYNGWHNDVARAVLPSRSVIGPRISPGEYPFIPSSAGIPEDVKQKVHCVNFNDLASVEYVLKRYPVACVLTEPVLQNVGIVLPKPGYLQGLVDLCEKYEAVCIFDEVKTGFRSALGGYQGVAGVTPHLSVFGKAIANGYPLGVVGGKRNIMELFDAPNPQKRVMIAGTYNAHPVNTAAAIATLEILQNPEIYNHLSKVSNLLYDGLEALFRGKGIRAVIARNASASCTYFCEHAPQDAHDILENHDFDFDVLYRKALIKKGIYQIPIACKQSSISYSHTEEDIYHTLEMNKLVLNEI